MSTHLKTTKKVLAKATFAMGGASRLMIIAIAGASPVLGILGGLHLLGLELPVALCFGLIAGLLGYGVVLRGAFVRSSVMSTGIQLGTCPVYRRIPFKSVASIHIGQRSLVIILASGRRIVLGRTSSPVGRWGRESKLSQDRYLDELRIAWTASQSLTPDIPDKRTGESHEIGGI